MSHKPTQKIDVPKRDQQKALETYFKTIGGFGISGTTTSRGRPMLYDRCDASSLVFTGDGLEILYNPNIRLGKILGEALKALNG